MNDEYQLPRNSRRPISSFFLHPLKGGHRVARLHAPARRHRQRRKPPRRLEQRQIIPRIHLHRRDVMESRARDEKAGAAGGPFISRVRTPYGSITAR